MIDSGAEPIGEIAKIQVLRPGISAKEIAASPAALALGIFDGVHLGHQSVLQSAAKCAAESKSSMVVVTFDPHPAAVIDSSRAPLMLYPVEKRLAVLSEYGVDAAQVLRFDLALSRCSPDDFLTRLISNFRRVTSISVGNGFAFGFKRSGNLETLAQFGHSHRIAICGVPPVEQAGEMVSSTRVREAVRAGRFEEAGALLGRAYRLVGSIIQGDKRGRQIGFPTANLETSGLVVPPNGVYAVRLNLKGRNYNAVANIGNRPTVASDGGSVRAEVHILEFSGDIYRETVEVEFLKKLRDEAKFLNLESLRRQIQDDIASAARFF